MHHPADQHDTHCPSGCQHHPTPHRVIKIGRNDPCLCGSGRKYKKCCLGKNECNT